MYFFGKHKHAKKKDKKQQKTATRLTKITCGIKLFHGNKKFDLLNSKI